MNLPGSSIQQVSANLGLAGRDAVHFHTGSTTAIETIHILLTQRCNVITPDGTYATTIHLPPVAEAAGMLFFFYATAAGADVLISDNGDDSDFVDFSLTAANDCAVLVSSGLHWHHFGIST